MDLFLAKKNKKQPRLDINHFFQLVIANNVKNDLDLCVIAKKQMDEGKMDLNRFVMSRTERQREDLIKNAWKIQNSVATLERSKKTNMELLEEARYCDHSYKCTGEWLPAALLHIF